MQDKLKQEGTHAPEHDDDCLCSKCWCKKHGFESIEDTEWEFRDLYSYGVEHLGISLELFDRQELDQGDECMTSVMISYLGDDGCHETEEILVFFQKDEDGELDITSCDDLVLSWVMHHPQVRDAIVMHIRYFYQVIEWRMNSLENDSVV